jgi:hypothetical protein
LFLENKMLDNTQIQQLTALAEAMSLAILNGQEATPELTRAVSRLNNRIMTARREGAKRPTARKALAALVDTLGTGALVGDEYCPVAYVAARAQIAGGHVSYWINIAAYNFDDHTITGHVYELGTGQRRSVKIHRRDVHMAVVGENLTVWAGDETPDAHEIATRRRAADCTGLFFRHTPFDQALRQVLSEKRGAVLQMFAAAQAAQTDVTQPRKPGRPAGSPNKMRAVAAAGAAEGYTPLPGSSTRYYRPTHFIENAHGATCSIETGRLVSAGNGKYDMQAETLMHTSTSPRALRKTPVRFLLGRIPEYQGVPATPGANFSLACKQVIWGIQYLADANGKLHIYTEQMHQAFVQDGARGLAELLGTQHPALVSDARGMWQPTALVI